MKTINVLLLATICASSMTACAPMASSSAYSYRQARQEMEVRLGVVESVRQVAIKGDQSPVGTVAGAVIGGLIGSNIGQGKGAAAGTILGAVAGGAAGAAIEGEVNKKMGIEITVRLESGKLVAITQDADEVFRPGERVRVLSGGGVTRVGH